MGEHPVPLELHAEREAVREIVPVRTIERHAVPGFVRLLDHLVQAQPLALVLHVAKEPSRVEEPHEPVQVGVPGDERPVRFVILAISIPVRSTNAFPQSLAVM
jgi:hypothetical protein